MQTTKISASWSGMAMVLVLIMVKMCLRDTKQNGSKKEKDWRRSAKHRTDHLYTVPCFLSGRRRWPEQQLSPENQRRRLVRPFGTCEYELGSFVVLCFFFFSCGRYHKPFDPCRRGTRHVSIKQDVVFAHVLCMQSYVHVMSVPLVLQDPWSWTRAIRCRMTKLKPNLWLEISIDSFWTWFWPASLAWSFCRH